MDSSCGVCLGQAEQLFETSKPGVLACMKCQPLVPEVTMDDSHSPIVVETVIISKIGPDGKYHCEMCNKSFSKASQHQNHIKNHRAERRYVCVYCPKAFSQSNNLRAHLRIHTNERPYKCHECGKAFTQVTNLNNHIRLHTGERPYRCSEPGCTKAYAQVTNLNQHRKRHLTGVVVESCYDCNICGKSFEQRNHLAVHRRHAHADIKVPAKGAARPVHVCHACDECFITARELQMHAATHQEGGVAEPQVSIHELGGEWHAEDDEDEDGPYKCVFGTCTRSFKNPELHKQHLFHVHDLKVKGNFKHRTQPKHNEQPPIIPCEEPRTVPKPRLVPRIVPRTQLRMACSVAEPRGNGGFDNIKSVSNGTSHVIQKLKLSMDENNSSAKIYSEEDIRDEMFDMEVTEEESDTISEQGIENMKFLSENSHR